MFDLTSRLTWSCAAICAVWAFSARSSVPSSQGQALPSARIGVVQNGSVARLDSKVEPERRPRKIARPSVAPDVAAHVAHEWLAELDHVTHEPVDEDWAEDTEDAIFSAVSTMADSLGFMARDARCYTDHCVVDLEWADRATAFASLNELLSMELPATCDRRVELLAEGEAQRAYQSTLLLSCERTE